MFGKMILVIPAAFLFGCTEISSNKADVLSVRFDSLAAPSVVVGDTLRDTLGVISPAHATAFNYQNDSIPSPTIRFRALERGVTVDSLNGLIIGDSLRATAVRIIAAIGPVQAQQLLATTLRPDTIFNPATVPDSIVQSLLDTTKNISIGVGAKLVHRAAVDSPVPAYIVSFAITSPLDNASVELVNDAGLASHVDTTSSDGTVSRRIRLHLNITGTVVPDSVVIAATAKYRGAIVKGSPVRLVVKIIKKTTS
jgi:hypothetical protein